MAWEQTRWNADKGVMKPIKKIAEQARLHMTLEDQQTRAKELYYVIGRACYHQGLEHMPPDCRLAAEELNALMAEMIRNQERLTQLGETVTCSACGHEISSESQFCIYCGNGLRTNRED